ncbi:hypothetical protein BST85_02885 [Aureitalea marina]|uniref:DUF481 domain-containing protein n=2 Tax=Aureitalea marina TaxID=930804 RepID=A0A2S7KTG5_9FLAO|nr:hypothetical protein BST85_02885 [Aureitalea marina]
MHIQSKLLLLFITWAIGFSALAQKDTLHLKSGEVLIGEVKSMAAGVLVMETSYSDSDFMIEFDKVVKLNVERRYSIVLTRGRRRFGQLKPDPEADRQLRIVQPDGSFESVKLWEIIALREVEGTFWQRTSGSIDFGYNLTKANNSNQYTLGIQLGYIGEQWTSDFKLNALRTAQDNVEDVQRTDATAEIIRIIGKRWYVLGNVSFLSNTEQAIRSRYSPSLGGGRLLVATNKLFWGVALGFTYNIENFEDPSLDKNSAEVFVNTSLNMFDFKDFSLTTGLKIYPSITESGRWRSDFDLNLKYDLPLDFYIKMGTTVNFDNQPAVEGNDFDYVFTTGVGWEFNK